MAKWVGRDGRVVAFEPEPTNFSYLQKSMAANAYQNVICINKALGDAIGSVPFEVRDNATGCVNTGEAQRQGTIISVSATTGDTLVEHEGVPPPDAVKIDVEGYEFHVLRGLRHVLSTFQPTLFIEVHSSLAGKDRRGFFSLLRESSYDLRVLEGDEDGRSEVAVAETSTIRCWIVATTATTAQRRGAGNL